MSDKSKKRIMLPPNKQKAGIDKSRAVLLPELQSIIDDASHTVGLELAKIRRRAEISTAPMDPESARLFQGYVKSAVELSREARERDKLDDSDGLSDQEVLQLFLENMKQEEVVRLLQDTINKKDKDEASRETKSGDSKIDDQQG